MCVHCVHTHTHAVAAAYIQRTIPRLNSPGGSREYACAARRGKTRLETCLAHIFIPCRRHCVCVSVQNAGIFTVLLKKVRFDNVMMIEQNASKFRVFAHTQGEPDYTGHVRSTGNWCLFLCERDPRLVPIDRARVCVHSAVMSNGENGRWFRHDFKCGDNCVRIISRIG